MLAQMPWASATAAGNLVREISNELPVTFSMRLETKFLAQLLKPSSPRGFSIGAYIDNPMARPLTGQYDANQYRRALSKLRPKIAPFNPRSPQRQSKIG
jgi:hypothetical protein